MRHETEHKSFDTPDETREFPTANAEILSIGEGRGRPDDVQARLAVVQRRQADRRDTTAARRRTSSTTSAASSTIRMDDGTEMIADPGDITSLPSGHDAWVVGDDRQSSWSTSTARATTPRRIATPQPPATSTGSDREPRE